MWATAGRTRSCGASTVRIWGPDGYPNPILAFAFRLRFAYVSLFFANVPLNDADHADVGEAFLVLFKLATLSGWGGTARIVMAARSESQPPGELSVCLSVCLSVMSCHVM